MRVEPHGRFDALRGTLGALVEGRRYYFSNKKMRTPRKTVSLGKT